MCDPLHPASSSIAFQRPSSQCGNAQLCNSKNCEFTSRPSTIFRHSGCMPYLRNRSHLCPLIIFSIASLGFTYDGGQNISSCGPLSKFKQPICYSVQDLVKERTINLQSRTVIKQLIDSRAESKRQSSPL